MLSYVQIFFPINFVNHYYVICFNLRNIGVQIIDNNILGGDMTTIYDGIPESLVRFYIIFYLNHLIPSTINIYMYVISEREFCKIHAKV